MRGWSPGWPTDRSCRGHCGIRSADGKSGISGRHACRLTIWTFCFVDEWSLMLSSVFRWQRESGRMRKSDRSDHRSQFEYLYLWAKLSCWFVMLERELTFNNTWSIGWDFLFLTGFSRRVSVLSISFTRSKFEKKENWYTFTFTVSDRSWFLTTKWWAMGWNNFLFLWAARTSNLKCTIYLIPHANSSGMRRQLLAGCMQRKTHCKMWARCDHGHIINLLIRTSRRFLPGIIHLGRHCPCRRNRHRHEAAVPALSGNCCR